MGFIKEQRTPLKTMKYRKVLCIAQLFYIAVNESASPESVSSLPFSFPERLTGYLFFYVTYLLFCPVIKIGEDNHQLIIKSGNNKGIS